MFSNVFIDLLLFFSAAVDHPLELDPETTKQTPLSEICQKTNVFPCDLAEQQRDDPTLRDCLRRQKDNPLLVLLLLIIENGLFRTEIMQ